MLGDDAVFQSLVALLDCGSRNVVGVLAEDGVDAVAGYVAGFGHDVVRHAHGDRDCGQELELGPFRFGFVVVGLGDLESKSLEVADDVLPSS